MLLPGKSQDEIAQVLRRMIKEDTDDSGNIKASSSSSFELRIREIYLENKKELKQKSNQERKKFKKKKARVTGIDEADSGTSKSTVGKLIPMSNQPIRNDLKDVSDDGNDMDNEFRNVHSSNGQNGFSESVGPSTSSFLINDPDIQMKRNGMKLPPVRLSPLENTIDTPKRKKKKKKLKDTFEDSEV
ncbi:unnamed protein product [Acanthosepion pharaonis]|uniref:Uncharacterized protein n=1 Tax=Acanthosepion pharaonis TaxID=158019 RepID=A0A812E8Z8_ACAPH|nr:unnamed protein product [Sepia pharaonis]